MGSKLVDAMDGAPSLGEWRDEVQSALLTRMSNAERDRFMASVDSLVSSTPALARASAESVTACVLLAANLGLDVNPILGEFHLSTRVHETPEGVSLIAVPIIGYQGYAKLAYNTGMVEKIETLFIRKDDEWDMWADSDKGRQFRWRPKDDDEARPWERVLALVKIINAGTVWVSLTIEQVKTRRSDTPFWTDHFDAMARKTAIRELAPLMPKNVALAQAYSADEKHVINTDGTIVDVEA